MDLYLVYFGMVTKVRLALSRYQGCKFFIYVIMLALWLDTKSFTHVKLGKRSSHLTYLARYLFNFIHSDLGILGDLR